MSVPEDVSDWIATPATLNDRKCGNNLVFSRENSIVQRRAPQYSGDCVIYTSHPLSPGQPWQMTVLERSLKCTGGLAIGVTATQSDVVPSLLDGLSSGPQDWYYWASVLYHNGRELSSNLPHLWDLNTNQKVGFLLSSNGDLHIYLDGQHIIKAASGLPVGKSLWGAVDVYGSCTKIKSELLNDPAVYLRVAMKDGYIPHKDDLFLIHGPGGVGKSSLVSMFLGKQRDLARVSTAVAEESLHICPVRDVSTSMFTDQWELVDIDRQARMVAHTSRHLLTNESVQKVAVETKSSLELVDHEEATETEPFLAKPAPSSAVLPTFEPLISHNRPTQSHDNSKESLTKKKSLRSSFKFWRRKRKKLKEAAKLSVTSEESEPEKLITTLGDDPENIQGILDRIQDDLQKLMHDSEEIMELFLYYSIHVVDSGGQPQFHEVVSIILQAVTAIVTVLKLSEPLDVHGEVVFYKDGVQANDAYKSYLTNEQVIRHDLLAIQSEACRSNAEEVPNLAFVGTFLDQQHVCPKETPDRKDELLHSMIIEILPEELQDCIISSGESLQQVMFRLNTRTPNKKDYETAGRLKEALMSLSQVKPKNLPLKWCSYEVALRKMMVALQRQVLSLQECEFIGCKLGFDPPSLKACLHYLRKFHIISFYNFLPNVIFGSCQVILDKITELVTYSLELKIGKRALTGAERKFHQQGIISQKILTSVVCSSHYRQGLFTTDDLLTILSSLFIITNVGPKEYLMPCVLEVSDIFPSPPLSKGYTRSSFVLHFSKKSPMLGIFCCTISYLLTRAGWTLLRKGGEVVQVARNSVTFELPRKFSGKLTFFDPLSSYLLVEVELPKTFVEKHRVQFYCEIRETFTAAIRQAMKTLNYEVRTPELSFMCPEQSSRCSTLPHLATVDESHKHLVCSTNPGSVYHLLTSDQILWLTEESVKKPDSTQSSSEIGSSSRLGARSVSRKQGTTALPMSISGSVPTMPQLLKMKLPVRVAPQVYVFGTILLEDKIGNKMEIIRGNHQGRPEEMAMEVLREWLAGKGVEVSWENLISTLRDCELSLMASQIRMAFDQLIS